jgi:hypothetical protein
MRLGRMNSATKFTRNSALRKMAEGVGFEPTKLSFAGFQDRCTRPLCEPSVGEITRIWLRLKIGADLGGQIQKLFDDLCDAIGFTWFSYTFGKSWGFRVTI